MVLAKSGLIWLLIAQVIAATSIVVGQGLDLNETPEEEEFKDARETFSTTSTTCAPKRVIALVRKSNKKVTNEFYAKVEKLFKVLQVCDDENFNINRIDIPDNISAESKAMMALEKVGRSNLIKKSDKTKYNRIMVNCAKLMEAVNAKTESKLSMDSQLSGGTWDERLARLKDSVLDNLRDRFTGPALPTATSSPTTTIMPKPISEQFHSQMPLTRLQDTYDIPYTGERRLIQFF